MFLIKMCEHCVNKNDEWNAGDINGFFEAFSPDDNICPYCHGILIDTNLSYDEFRIVKKVSSDTNFIEAMIKLKQDDIIEYNLKMSQFKTQEEQQKQDSSSTEIKCPTCSSTNIEKIGGLERVGSVAMWGLFSKKINKSFKCKDCGYTW